MVERKPIASRKKSLNISLTLKSIVGLRKLAEARGLSRSTFIDSVIRWEMGKYEITVSDEEMAEAIAARDMDRLEAALK